MNLKQTPVTKRRFYDVKLATNTHAASLLMFLLSVSSLPACSPIVEDAFEAEAAAAETAAIPAAAGPKEPRDRSVADTCERRPRVPPADILRMKEEVA